MNRSLQLPVESRPTKGESRRVAGEESRVVTHAQDAGGLHQDDSSREMVLPWISKGQPTGFVEKT